MSIASVQRRVRTLAAVFATGFAIAAAQPAVAGALATTQFYGSCSSYCGYLDGPNGNKRYFTTSDSNGNTVHVKATAWSIFGGGWDGGNHMRSFLGHYSAGLGVNAPGRWPGDGNGRYGRHQTDNIGSKDYIVLQFDQLVKPTAVGLRAFDIKKGHYWYRDNDANILIGNTGVGWNDALDPGAVFANLSTDLHRVDVNGNGYNTHYNIDATGHFGNVIIIAADLFYGGGWHDSPDAFKLKYLTFMTRHQVPAPGALALFGLGILAMGLARRKQQHG